MASFYVNVTGHCVVGQQRGPEPCPITPLFVTMIWGFPLGLSPPFANCTGVGGKTHAKQKIGLGPAYVMYVGRTVGLTLIEGVDLSGATLTAEEPVALGIATCCADSDDEPMGAVVINGESIVRPGTLRIESPRRCLPATEVCDIAWRARHADRYIQERKSQKTVLHGRAPFLWLLEKGLAHWCLIAPDARTSAVTWVNRPIRQSQEGQYLPQEG